VGVCDLLVQGLVMRTRFIHIGVYYRFVPIYIDYLLVNDFCIGVPSRFVLGVFYDALAKLPIFISFGWRVSSLWGLASLWNLFE